MTFQWRDNYIRILSVFIALLLWVYVTNEQNPVTDQTFSVPLVAQGAPRGYDVDGLPGTVSVRVRGTRIVIGTLQRENFSARVNLSEIEPGEQEVRVQLTSPPEVEVLQIYPPMVTVRADRIEDKNVPVRVVLKGAVDESMQAGAPAVAPQVVTIRGPAGLLNEIKQLAVTVDVSGADETLVREVRLETGMEDVTVNPDRVKVTVPVTTLSVQSMPVRLRTTGEPAAGYEVSSTTVSPQTVQVTARDNVLRGMTAVSTMALDITGISSDVEREVVLILPDGARLVEPDRVMVTVRVIQVEEEQPPPEEESEGEGADEGEGGAGTGAETGTGTGVGNR